MQRWRRKRLSPRLSRASGDEETLFVLLSASPLILETSSFWDLLNHMVPEEWVTFSPGRPSMPSCRMSPWLPAN